MQKIKYIIIFALALALGLLYIQIDDYDKISNSLLKENISSNDEIKSLKDTIEELQTQNTLLKEELTALKQSIEESKSTIHSEDISSNITIQGTDSENIQLELQNTAQDIQISDSIHIQPNASLENENAITGFDPQDAKN